MARLRQRRNSDGTFAPKGNSFWDRYGTAATILVVAAVAIALLYLTQLR